MKEYITWTDSFSVKARAIDEQHKQVFRLLNDIYNTITADRKTAPHAVNDLLFRLRLFTETHFTYEEKMLEVIGYPDLREHAKYHRSMIDKTRKITKEIQEKVKDRQDLLLFLKQWWQSHIRGNDMKYAAYVEKLEM